MEELLTIHEELEASAARGDLVPRLTGPAKSYAWKMGLDEDVYCESIRHCETRNWIKHVVMPFAAEKERW